jgi:hypothetical protein
VEKFHRRFYFLLAVKEHKERKGKKSFVFFAFFRGKVVSDFFCPLRLFRVFRG